MFVVIATNGNKCEYLAKRKGGPPGTWRWVDLDNATRFATAQQALDFINELAPELFYRIVEEPAFSYKKSTVHAHTNTYQAFVILNYGHPVCHTSNEHRAKIITNLLLISKVVF